MTIVDFGGGLFAVLRKSMRDNNIIVFVDPGNEFGQCQTVSTDRQCETGC